MKLVILTLLLVFMDCSFGGEIYINKVKLNDSEIAALKNAYGIVQPGRYWYDSVAGLWGYENGPTQGKAFPNVYFRGKLPADISGNGTNIFINGREIHIREKQYLESIYGVGNVKTGRYWLNHLGVGGYEGGAALFKLPQPNRPQRISPFSTRDLAGGSVIGGSYIGTDGTSVTCGPDGGCIY
jgi:hypothetical protein